MAHEVVGQKPAGKQSAGNTKDGLVKEIVKSSVVVSGGILVFMPQKDGGKKNVVLSCMMHEVPAVVLNHLNAVPA